MKDPPQPIYCMYTSVFPLFFSAVPVVEILSAVDLRWPGAHIGLILLHSELIITLKQTSQLVITLKQTSGPVRLDHSRGRETLPSDVACRDIWPIFVHTILSDMRRTKTRRRRVNKPTAARWRSKNDRPVFTLSTSTSTIDFERRWWRKKHLPITARFLSAKGELQATHTGDGVRGGCKQKQAGFRTCYRSNWSAQKKCGMKKTTSSNAESIGRSNSQKA